MVNCIGEVMAQHVFDVFSDYDSLESMKALLVDNNFVNTGSKNCLVVKQENKLGRNLRTVGCALHQKQLSFRSLFKKLDGSTTGPQNFSGQLG